MSLQSTWSNLNRVAGCLRTWSRDSFGCVRKQIQKLERRLKTISSSPISEAMLIEERTIEGRLCELFDREEIMERQRSRWTGFMKGTETPNFFMPGQLQGIELINFLL